MADPPTILVVDDEQSYRDALAVSLRRAGFLVQVAADGIEALDRYDTFRPALVLLDVMLPRLSGIDVCRVLTRDVLMDRVWGPSYVGDTKTLDVHIKRLRAKIEENPSSPTRITTIRGLGYRYEKPRVVSGMVENVVRNTPS